MPTPGATTLIVVFLLAYIAGATPFGFLAARWKGVDIRQHGSGNIGATNVIRVMGKKIGLPVFALDCLKGVLPVIFAKAWCGNHGFDSTWASLLAGLGSVMGHNFTFWLNFKGGKGVATSAGVMLALLPVALLAGLVVWLILFHTTRFVAVASMGAGAALPLAVLAQRAVTGAPALPLLGFAAIIGGLAIWRHRSNLKRLMAGTENRFERRSKTPVS
ncbi:MAG: glycerol-3-phosphate 1-O-acyltransferase PlsY [Verrucomicrobiota bacterium]